MNINSITSQVKIRTMKIENVYKQTARRELSQEEAASILSMSERTFQRWRDRFEAEGVEGLYDCRLNRVSSRRVPVDTVIEVLELFDTRYWDFTAGIFMRSLFRNINLRAGITGLT